MTTEIKQLAIRLCRAIENNFAIAGEYHAKNVESGGYQLQVEEGRKYYKLVVVNGQSSVHAFVDKLTGDLYKPVSYNPYKYEYFYERETLSHVYHASKVSMVANGRDVRFTK